MTEQWMDGRDMALREQEDRKAALRAEIDRLEAQNAELLEAAERALVEHEDAGCSCRGCQMLRAAIAKAKGGVA